MADYVLYHTEDIDLEALLIGGPSCESAASISRWLQTRHQNALASL